MLLCGEHFQADDGDNQRGDEEKSPEGGRLVEDEDAQQHRSEGPDAGPHGVGGADGERLGGFGQQHGAEHIKGGESRHPLPIGQPDQPLGLAETEGEAYLTKSCYNEYYPMHGVLFLICKDTTKR